MLKTEDLKTACLKSEDSKYAFMCWEPHMNMYDKSPFILSIYLKNMPNMIENWAEINN